MAHEPAHNDESLLPLRAAVVLLFAIIIGAIAGGLTFLAAKSAPPAIIAGGSAFGAAVIWLDKLIGG